MNIDIYAPSPCVPGYIIRYLKEKIRLAGLQNNRIDHVCVTLKESVYFDSKWYVCELGFIFQDQSFLITKRATSYFEAAYEASRDLFDKIKKIKNALPG